MNKHLRSNVGSPHPIDGGAGTRTLWRRVEYGGRKGRAARRRLHALERRIARLGLIQAAMTAQHAWIARVFGKGH
jgi:hypothetical protein